MAGMDWFRWHHGSVTDPKFQLVARKAGCSVAEIIGVWATLLEAASMSDVRGCHGVLDFEAIDCSLGLDDGKAEQIYTLMNARGLVNAESKSITSWSKRQPVREREDDNSTERVKAFRDKKRQSKQSNTSETPCNATETPKNTSETPCNATKRLEEIREENTPHTPHGGLPPVEGQPEQSSAVTTEHTDPAQPVAIVADAPEQSAIVADGEHGDKGTAQTVADPPVATPPPGEVRQLRRKTRESGAVSMDDWIAAEKSAGRKPIPDDDPVFDYAQKAGIPDEMLSLAWVEFRARYRANPRKRYTDWQAVFRNAVRGNWFKLWFFDETGAYRLTTAGRQAEAVAA